LQNKISICSAQSVRSDEPHNGIAYCYEWDEPTTSVNIAMVTAQHLRCSAAH